MLFEVTFNFKRVTQTFYPFTKTYNKIIENLKPRRIFKKTLFFNINTYSSAVLDTTPANTQLSLTDTTISFNIVMPVSVVSYRLLVVTDTSSDKNPHNHVIQQLHQ